MCNYSFRARLRRRDDVHIVCTTVGFSCGVSTPYGVETQGVDVSTWGSCSCGDSTPCGVEGMRAGGVQLGVLARLAA